MPLKRSRQSGPQRSNAARITSVSLSAPEADAMPLEQVAQLEEL